MTILLLLGDYYIRVYFGDCPIGIFPIIAMACQEDPPSIDALVIDTTPPQILPDKVSVYGPGISTAFVYEHVEFVVDGHEAGPGKTSSR